MSHSFEALIFLDIAPAERFSVENKLLEFPQVVRMFEVLGEYEVVIEIKVKDKTELGSILNTLAMTKGVRGIKTFLITKFLKR